MYDADTRLQEFERPAIRLGGATFEGRPLSLADTARLLRSFKSLMAKIEVMGAGAEEEADESTLFEELAAFVADVCGAMGFTPEIQARVLQLPPDLILEALQDFFGSLRRRRASAPAAESPVSPTPSSS